MKPSPALVTCLLLAVAVLALALGCLGESRMRSIPAAGRPVEELLVRLRARSPAVRADAARELGRRRLAVAPNLLSERLEDPAPEVRLAAVEGLGLHGGAEAATALARALGGADPALRQPAALALGRLQPGLALAPLLQGLATRDRALRLAVARQVAGLGPTAWPGLWSKATAGGDDGIAGAGAALRAMGPAQQRQAVAAFLRLAGEEESHRHRLVALLGPLGVAAIDGALDHLIGTTALRAGRLAVRVLADLGEAVLPRLNAALVRAVRTPPAVPRPGAAPPVKKAGAGNDHPAVDRLALVYRALGSRGVLALCDLHPGADAEVKAVVDRLLGRAPGADWNDALRRRRTDPSPARRVEILERLQAMDGRRAAPDRITPFLEDERVDVVAAAVRHLFFKRYAAGPIHAAVVAALRRWVPRLPDSEGIVEWLIVILGRSGPAATPFLLELRRLPSPMVRMTALHALGEAGGPEALRELVATVRLADPLEATPAVQGLARLRAVEGLILAAAHRDPEVRRAALEALGSLPDPRVKPVLRRALGDADPRCVLAGLRADALRHDPAAVPSVLRRLAERRVDLAAAAAEALGRLGGVSATAGLLRALGRPEPAVRRATVLALGQLRAKGAETPLRRLIKDPDEGVRQAVASALMSITGKLPPGSNVQVTGIPLCDRVLHLYACVISRSPQSTRATLQQGLGQMATGVRSALQAGPAARQAMDTACQSLLDTLRKAFSSFPAYGPCLP